MADDGRGRDEHARRDAVPDSQAAVLQLLGVAQEVPGRRGGVLRRRARPEHPLAGIDLTLRAGEVAR